MTKAELVGNVAKVSGITRKEADLAVVEVFDSIRAALLSGEKVTVVGFGTFAVKDVAARKGRNPQTGESIDIAARTKVTFKGGKELKMTIA